MMRFFGTLFIILIVWHTYKMFRDVWNGTKGVKQGTREAQPNREGHVTIHQTRQTPPKKVSDDVGEYVDFKEVKDKH